MAKLLEFKNKHKEKYYVKIDVLAHAYGWTSAEISFKNVTKDYDL